LGGEIGRVAFAVAFGIGLDLDITILLVTPLYNFWDGVNNGFVFWAGSYVCWIIDICLYVCNWNAVTLNLTPSNLISSILASFRGAETTWKFPSKRWCLVAVIWRRWR
jgi:hypothetical protein